MFYQYFLRSLLKYAKNNREYLIQNMICYLIKSYDFTLEVTFQAFYVCMAFLTFPMYIK